MRRFEKYNVTIIVEGVEDGKPSGIKLKIAMKDIKRSDIIWIAFAHYWLENYRWTDFEGILIHWRYKR